MLRFALECWEFGLALEPDLVLALELEAELEPLLVGLVLKRGAVLTFDDGAGMVVSVGVQVRSR